jgi:hypothetical protein
VVGVDVEAGVGDVRARSAVVGRVSAVPRMVPSGPTPTTVRPAGLGNEVVRSCSSPTWRSKLKVSPNGDNAAQERVDRGPVVLSGLLIGKATSISARQSFHQITRFIQFVHFTNLETNEIIG